MLLYGTCNYDLLLWSKVLVVFIESFGEESNTCFFVVFFVCLTYFFLRLNAFVLNKKGGKMAV